MKYDVIFVSGNLNQNFPSPSIATLKSILNRDTRYKSKTIDLTMYNPPITNMKILSDRPFKPAFRPVTEFECMPVFIGIKNAWDKNKKLDFEFLRNNPFKQFLLEKGIYVDQCISEFKTYTDIVRDILNSNDFSAVGISVLITSLLQAELISLLVREKDPQIPIS